MDPIESPPSSKSGVIVMILVVVGIAAVGIGGYLVWSKKNGNANALTKKVADSEVESWCKVRQQWQREVSAINGDILLKSARAEDAKELQELKVKRNKACQDFASKLRDINVTNPVLQAVEVALVNEGKVRSNVQIEIHNLLTKIDAMQSDLLGKDRDKLQNYIQRRIANGKGDATKAIATAMSQLKGQACNNIYRGPMTDEGTSGDPYTTWDELELQRTKAIRKFDERIKELEPVEEFTNRVYHKLVGSAKYRKDLTKCYKRAKAAKPKMSPKMGFRLRLDRRGKVKGLAVEWMLDRGDGGDEKFLDCVERVAAKWKLPIPVIEAGKKDQVVVVSLDFNIL